ncbi:MAG: DUF2007 domain-containing protein [Candidatus Acetothermia bacterium]|jgi:hypothetical protein|nr:DUF2007 domain-containing protein [Candidatus Acetothermia bacterium]MDH7505169.1 DUF2007 domain-containing protein [Candidatus Acetothermia bacterium]
MGYVTVYCAWGEAEAQVVRGLLESSGVKCRLRERGPQSLYPVTVDGLAEVQIMVSAEDEPAARAIVASYRGRGEGGQSEG